MNGEYLRDYELSIWTLQDRFINVLKWSGMEYRNPDDSFLRKYAGIGQKGLIQNGTIKIANDGTEELDFSVPKFYYENGIKIANPLWKYFEDNNFTSNMYKVKVIFNKMTEDERIFEFVLHSIVLTHEKDEVIYDIHGVGLAFEELGKLGYKISLSKDDYEEDYKDWFENHLSDAEYEMPLANILYWNDKIFKNSNSEINLALTDLEISKLMDAMELTEDNFEETMLEYGFEKIGEKWMINRIVVNNFNTMLNELKFKDHPTSQEVLLINALGALLNKFNKEDEWKYLWHYKVEMDWSSFNNYLGTGRDSDKVYEEAYISSWDDLNSDITYLLTPKAREDYREKARLIDLKESNIYNLTLSIAETFGVYCKYEYEYDENYHIIGRNVIYYNNYLLDRENVIDLTYPYTIGAAVRLVDSTDIVTKMFVRPIDSSEASNNVITIMNVDANKSREDYLLNFDYLYNIKTITDEQHEAINKYEIDMHNFNIWLMEYEFRINQLLNEALSLKSKVTYYTNAIALDKERISLASALRDELTYTDNSLGNEGYITRGQDNPVSLLVVKKEDGGRIVYSASLSLLGVLPRSVLLYQKLDYTQKINEGRLNTEPISFEFAWDDFGDLNKIDKIVFSGTEIPTILYMTCQYSPKLYYDKVVKVWESRLDLDSREKEIVEKLLFECYVRLYGADVDYALADYSTTDGVELLDSETYLGYCVGFSRAGEDIAHPITENNYNDNLAANRGYARIDMVELEDAHALVCEHEYTLLKKDKAITAFERLMGPALREGYWQPDNYNDYGDLFYDEFTLTFDQIKPSRTISGNMNPNLVSFIWDEERFEEENKLTYALGVDTRTLAYLVVDLSARLNLITGNLDDLSFIYYDKEIDTLIAEINSKEIYTDQMKQLEMNAIRAEINANEDLTEEEKLQAIDTAIAELNVKRIFTNKMKQEEIERIKKKSMRSFSIHSKCEFGYIADEDTRNIIPVLIVTGVEELSNELIDFMLNSNSLYKPFIGKITTLLTSNVTKELAIRLFEATGYSYTTDEALQSYMETLGYTWDAVLEVFKPMDIIVETFVETFITNLKFYNKYTENGGLELDHVYSIKKSMDLTGYDGRYYPRIYIKSLELKMDSDNFLLNVNGTNLTMYEDYYILVRSILDLEAIDGYYVTIKPEALLKYGMKDLKISMSYCVSNADISVYLDALKVLKENAYPKVSYDIKLNILNEKLVLKAYNYLNHIVHINDYEMGFENILGYISAITLDLDNAQNDNFEVKNYETKFEDLFSTIVALTESMKKNENAITQAANAFSSGIIKGDIILDSLLRGDLNYRFNSGKLTIDESNGIWGISDEGVVAFRGGGIFTATELNDDGTWQWNTGLLPSGLNAALITSGLLDTNKIKIYAGNKVRFLLNGEGLFAYKSLFSEEAVTTTAQQYIYQIQQKNGSSDIDASLYVTFNDKGLFLVAKKGALVLNEDRTAYHLMADDVNRVEVSWNGLIIRDVHGNNVFYADEQGNLTLKSTIYATSGEIGGWTITDTSLNSENIHFFSQTTNGQSGIYLTASKRTAGDHVKYLGIDFWAYKVEDDPTNYYVNEFKTSILRNTSHTVLSYLDYRDGVMPKNWKEVEIEGAPTMSTVTTYSGQNSDASGNDANYTYSGQLSTPNKTLVLCLTDSTGNTLSYHGQYIPFDYDTSLNATWYTNLTSEYGSSHTLYVDDIIKNSLLEVSTAEIPLDTTMTLYSFEPTFSVEATTGAMTVNNGTIGDFTITSTHLANGTLDGVSIKDNSIVIPRPTGSTADLSLSQYKDCFVDVSGDSRNGKLIFKRVSGGSVNFNIAAMEAYQNARKAAGELYIDERNTWHTNSTCQVQVYSGYGNIWTHKENISDVYRNGKNKGINDTLQNKTVTSVTANGTLSTNMSKKDALNTPVKVGFQDGTTVAKTFNATNVWVSGYNQFTKINETFYRKTGPSTYVEYTDTLYKKR